MPSTSPRSSPRAASFAWLGLAGPDGLPAGVIRGKGILAVTDAHARLIFHLVGGRWTVSAGDPWHPGEDRLNEMVFIGRDLNDAGRTALAARLNECVETEER